MAWEQLEIPIPGVTEPLPGMSGSDLSHSLLSDYGQTAERGATMLKITIAINDDDLYEIEAHNQGGALDGVCLYKIVINGTEGGVARHDRTDGAWVLAQRILDSFSAPEKTLQEERGPKAALPSTEGAERILKVHLERNRRDLLRREARASGEGQ